MSDEALDEDRIAFDTRLECVLHARYGGEPVGIKEVAFEHGTAYYFICEDCAYLSLPMDSWVDAAWVGERHSCTPIRVASSLGRESELDSSSEVLARDDDARHARMRGPTT